MRRHQAPPRRPRSPPCSPAGIGAWRPGLGAPEKELRSSGLAVPDTAPPFLPGGGKTP